MINEVVESLSHLKAKPTESLVSHTTDVLTTWNLLKDQYKDIIPVNDEFWQLSYLSCLFHDIGKIALNFQDVIQDKLKMNDNYIRHEFISGMLLYYVFEDYIKKQPHAAIAVFSHHKAFNDELFSHRERLAELRLNLSDFDTVLKYLQLKSTNLIRGVFDNENLTKLKNTKELNDLYEEFYKWFVRKYPSKFRRNDRKQYIFYKAILNTADWCASGHKDIRDKRKFSARELEDKTVFKLRKEGKHKIADCFSWMKFQKKCLKKRGNLLAIAPTGSGKTEGALLWASTKSESEKIIYLLPTRVTSNAIFERLKGYFGENHTAVIHSSAFFYRKQKDDDFHKGLYLIDKTFFKNINVCTIDQVLTTGFNLGYWELKTFHSLNARFIIDEIHLYAPFTLGLIISTIKYLKKEFNAQFFIMTATMPDKLQVLLKDTLSISEDSVIRDDELLEEKRNFFETKDCLVDGLHTEIVSELKKGKKVLIVVNTVNEAIRIYNKYKSYVKESICYHSRFIQKDRIQKEKYILKKEKECDSILLVATQVVEVCLDIDFDILFTENAPIDAIIQRAGRVNRKREKKYPTKVVIFREQEVTKKWVYSEVDGVLENTFKLLSNLKDPELSENELIELVNEVYKNYDVKTHSSFIEGLNAHYEVQRGNHYVKDVKANEKTFTREGLDSISVIPEKFYKYLSDKEIIEKTEHELSIRISYYNQFKSDKIDESHSWFKYVEADYDDEIGLSFKKKDNSNLPHTKHF